MITNIAILALRGLGLDARQRIANDADVTVATINRWIALNHTNLTRTNTMRAIERELGLSEDEILKDSKATTTTSI